MHTHVWGDSLWRKLHVLVFPTLWQPKEPYSSHIHGGGTVAGRGNADPMRLGKREKIEDAGLIGVGVEKRGLSGGIVVDAGPRDRLMGGGAADGADKSPSGHGLLGHARRSETNGRARPPEREEHHCEEGAERQCPAQYLAEKMAAETRRFLFFEAGRTQIVRVGTAEWQTRL